MARMRVGAPRRPQMVVAFVALLVGAALVAYPYVSDYVHKLHQVGVIQSHESAIESQTQEGLQRELEASYAYNERLLVNRVVVTDPFDPSNRPVTQEEYEQRCNVSNDGVMGSIVIPTIDVTVPIYHGTGEDALANGAGHLEATSLPVGGPSSHCVVAGHNGLPSVRIFDDLHKLKVGDYFVVQVLGEDHAYRITSTETVLPIETDSLVVEEGRDLMTLVTCTPYGLNTHRLLVHAERCEVPASWYEHERADAGSVTPDAGGMIVPFSLAGAAVALGIVGASAWRRKRSAPAGPASGPHAVHVRHGVSAQGVSRAHEAVCQSVNQNVPDHGASPSAEPTRGVAGTNAPVRHASSSPAHARPAHKAYRPQKRSSGGSAPFRVMPRVREDVHQEPRHARGRR